MLTKELQLGDVIFDSENPELGLHCVKNIREHEYYGGYGTVVDLVRVYPCPADFQYTGGVIVTIGYEEFTISAKIIRNWTLVSRRQLK